MKISFSDEKKPEQCSRSATWATRWFSVTLDLGVTLRGERDEFDLPTLRRGWGLTFQSGKQPLKRTSVMPKRNWLYFSTKHPAYIKERKYWTDLKRNFEENSRAILTGKRKHPAMMTYMERHQATAEIAREMKWSAGFVRAMTTPMVQRALLNGGHVTNEWGDEVLLSQAEMKQLEGVDLKQARLKWEGNSPMHMQLTKGDLNDEASQR